MTEARAHIARLPRTFAGVLAPLLLAATLASCGGGSSSSSTSTNAATPKAAAPVAVTPTELRAVAASAKHPVFWAGTFGGTYELTRIADGRTYVRYLPSGVPVGTHNLELTIGTYVRPTPPFDAVRTAAIKHHATVRTLKDGALAVSYPTRPQSVYLVFPRALYEVEVYDPSAATAMRLATTGKVVPIS